MKRFSLIILLALFVAGAANAQYGEDYINIGVDAGLALNDYYQTQFPAGFGANVKGLYGVGLNGQVSLSGAYMFFPLDTQFILPDGDNMYFNVIPAFLGYRFNFDNFFLEPQIGGAMHMLTTRVDQDRITETSFELGFAVEAGYVFNQVEATVRYQHSGASPFHLGLLAIRASYRIPLGY
ncbi:outer membrane beta-barrel protein [Pleomorphovibrio marinus]|uniref:outer membrane beta-barrel protein n=1 Tax=Pleomorphovibrio marinus TaxID=2164132 RepID=UPI0013005AD2|nr:outer membrane beta-barrel protein [Pleomorphovibrio marinus]